MDYKDHLSERELLLLCIQKLENAIENNDKDHGGFTDRLNSHSNQLKVIWGGGGLSAALAALLGIKGHQ